MNPVYPLPLDITISEQQFERIRARSGRYGYGNRVKTVCRYCGRIVADLDPGNGPGVRWAAHLASGAREAHALVCTKDEPYDSVGRGGGAAP
jgi:hypothetical protein